MSVLASLVDILIVAVLIYTVIQLLKRTQSIFIFRGIVSLLIVYLLAFYLGLSLTVNIFQFFFSFFIIILVVVFQREFRRFFEGFSFSLVGNLLFSPAIPEFNKTVESVVKSISYFLERKIGALIVFPGEMPIERHLDGGNMLDGRLSSSLLVSIFDPSSPGHDGAVIIEGNKVSRFGVHLPLADDIRAIRDHGTRHRAGLGLAERTDAFIVIVSEEKQTISLARNGKLEKVTIDELKTQLEAFGEHMFSRKSPSMWHILFRQNLPDRLVALAIALLLWLVVIGK
ncbi:MAG: diadenylate cyclase [Patescibacteria group bacterium]